MLKKIDTLWVQNDITEEQRKELVALAQENADPEQSNAPLQTQINELAKQQSTLNATVTSLNATVQKIKETVESGGTVVPEPEPEPQEEYPAWEPYNGIPPVKWRQVPSVPTAARSGNPWWIITSGSRVRLEWGRRFGKK